MKKSQYSVETRVFLTKDYAGYPKGTCFTVDDPFKYGKHHKIKVHDATGKPVMIPSKYLDV